MDMPPEGPAAPGSLRELATGELLAPRYTPVQKVSIPATTVTRALDGLRAVSASDEGESTIHMTADAVFASMTNLTAGQVVTFSPYLQLGVTVVPPPEAATDDPTLFDGWTVNLSLPFLAGGQLSMDDQPALQLFFDVAGSTAKLAGWNQPQADVAAFSGINVTCIVKEGGAAILTTLFAALPALAAGPGAFRERLLAELGPGSVDLITRLMTCF